jgi:hypothetical protein
MSGGGKGGSQTTTTKVEIPKWLEDPARRNIAKAEELAQIGFTPYYGPDVAALTPGQMAAMQNVNAAADAFGMASAGNNFGLPQAQDFGGVQGYSAFPIYDQAMGQLQSNMPGQYDALTAPFLDPVTGAPPVSPFLAGYDLPAMPSAAAPVGSGGGTDHSGPPAVGGGMPSFQGPNLNGTAGYGTGGFTGVKDMFDGGGPGASGGGLFGGLF